MNARVRDYGDHEEYPEFVPHGNELLVLAKHWLESELRVRMFTYGIGSASRSQAWRRDYAAERVHAAIEPLIGGEKIEKLIDQVYLEFCEEWSADERHRFLQGGGQLLAQQKEDEFYRLAEPDAQEVLNMIAGGSKESPVSSEEIEERLGLAEDQVWETVRSLSLDGRLVCYDHTQVCLPADLRSPGQPAYWCPGSQIEAEIWMEEVRSGLSRAVEAFRSVIRFRNEAEHRDASSRLLS
jgi:hypothetical protein